jgi:hypothetical protein
LIPNTNGFRWQFHPGGAVVHELKDPALVLGLAALAAGTPWPSRALLMSGSLVDGSVWWVELPRPTTQEVTLRAIATGPVVTDPDSPFTLRLPVVAGATTGPPRVTLTPPTAARYDAAVGESGPDGPVAIRLRTREPSPVHATTGRGWRFDALELTTRIEPDGRPSCVLTGRVLETIGDQLLVGLPAGSEIQLVKIAGRSVSVLEPIERTTEHQTIAIRLPAHGPGGTPFEINYRLPVPDFGWTPGVRYPVISPVLPGPPVPVRTYRSCSSEFRSWPELDGPDRPRTVEQHEFVVVRTDVLSGLGYAAAAVVLGILLSLIRGVERRGRMIGFAVGVGVLATASWVLPEGWSILTRPSLVVGLAGLTVLVLRVGHWPGLTATTTRRTGSTTSRLVPVSSTSSYGPAIVLVAVLASASGAQAPEAATVYLLSGPAGNRGELDVLVPRAVLGRLEAVANPAPPAVTLTTADYEGEATADAARFTARFQLLCPRDGEHPYLLSLGGVQLESMELDGRPAYPDGSRADRYGLIVSGRGRHELVARFRVPTIATGSESEVRLTVPDVPESRVRFTISSGARQPEVSTRRGAQTIRADGDRLRVEADHGGGRAVAIRWQPGSATNQPTALRVREACVWDLAGGHDSAILALVCRVEEGTISHLALDVPDDLEPGRFGFRTGDGRPGGPILKDWRLGPAVPGWHRLDLDFQTPVAGRFVVLMHLVQVRPGSRQPTLRFPRTIGAGPVEALYGVRMNGVVAADLPRTGVIDYPVDAMVKEFAVIPELGLDRSPPDRAFQRAPSGPAPELRPVLQPVAERPTWSAEVDWSVGPRVTADGIVRLTLPAGLSVAEFDLPDVLLDEVRAPDLATWVRSGSRVQLWLKKPTRELTVRWSGRLTGPAAKGEKTGIGLPVPRPPAGPGTTALRVRPVEGWLALPEPAPGVRWQPAGPAPTAELVAEVEAETARVALVPPAVPGAVSISESAETAGAGLRYTATLTVPPIAGRPQHFAVTLAGIPARAEAELRGPQGVGISSTGAGPDGPRWSIVVPATVAGPLVFTATARLSFGRLPEPQVTFGGAPVGRSDHNTLLLGPGLTLTDGPPGWRPATTEEAAGLQKAGREPPVGGSVWVSRDPAGQWTVTATPPGGTPSAPPAIVSEPPAPSFVPEAGGTADPLATVRDWALAAGWLAALAVVVALAGWGRPSWWPEQLTACGLLAGSLLGFETVAGLGFAIVAASGLAARALLAVRFVLR